MCEINEQLSTVKMRIMICLIGNKSNSVHRLPFNNFVHIYLNAGRSVKYHVSAVDQMPYADQYGRRLLCYAQQFCSRHLKLAEDPVVYPDILLVNLFLEWNCFKYSYIVINVRFCPHDYIFEIQEKFLKLFFFNILIPAAGKHDYILTVKALR